MKIRRNFLSTMLCMVVSAMVVGRLSSASEVDLFATTCEGSVICIDTTYEAVGNVTLTIPSMPSNGMASTTPCDPGNGNVGISYTPDAGFVGIDFFTYEIDDDDTGMGADQTGLVIVNVTECPIEEVLVLQSRVSLALCACQCCACVCQDLNYCLLLTNVSETEFDETQLFTVTVSGLTPDCFQEVVVCPPSTGETDFDSLTGEITWSMIDLSSGSASLCFKGQPITPKCVTVQAVVSETPNEGVIVIKGGCDFAECECESPCECPSEP